MPRDRHPQKDIESAVAAIEVQGWTVEMAKGHAWGIAKCPKGCCSRSIWSTPRNPTTFAKVVRRFPNTCPKKDDPTED